MQAYKHVLPAGTPAEPEPQTHEGYEWLYVLDGRLRVVLGELDIVLGAGEAAEFDTRTPHWFGSADGRRGRVPQPVRPPGRAGAPARRAPAAYGLLGWLTSRSLRLPRDTSRGKRWFH